MIFSKEVVLLNRVTKLLLICLLVSTVGLHAQAEGILKQGLGPCDFLTSTNQNVKTIIEAYESSQYLGFAVPNHETIFAAKEIVKLLKVKAESDLELKYIFIESPSELNETLFDFSMGKFPLEEISNKVNSFWFDKILESPQYSYIYSELFEVVEKINKKRPGDPLIITAIDGVSELSYKADKEKIIERNNQIFMGSIDREKDTALNFLNIISGNEDKKGIIFYHYAHILKNTSAMGMDISLKKYRNYHLGWLDIANAAHTGLHEKTHIILFDEIDEKYNPGGVLSNEQFSVNSYIKRYRGSTISTPENLYDSFDSYMNTSSDECAN